MRPARPASGARTRGRRAFTLLEVMIAMAILVLALTALLGHEGVAIQMSDYSNKMSQATLLAQGKLLDLEHKLIKDSMDVLDNCEEGDFKDEGFDRYRWKACAYKVEVGEGATEAITERFMTLLGGFGLDPAAAGAAGGEAGAAAGGSMAAAQMQMAIGAIPTFLQQLEDKIRKVRLEVTWKDSIRERTLVFERFVTLLGADVEQPAKDGEAELSLDELRELADPGGK